VRQDGVRQDGMRQDGVLGDRRDKTRHHIHRTKPTAPNPPHRTHTMHKGRKRGACKERDMACSLLTLSRSIVTSAQHHTPLDTHVSTPLLPHTYPTHTNTLAGRRQMTHCHTSEGACCERLVTATLREGWVPSRAEPSHSAATPECQQRY